MSIEIREAKTKKELKSFVKFPFKLYKDNQYWVPQLIRDDMALFNPNKNPAYDNAESRLFLAYKDGQLVGRVAGILNHAANDKYNAKNMRFGWFESINDFEVTKALIDAVEAYAKEKGMETLSGPHGFTDLDQEGMLFEGFDQLPTVTVYYNFEYYNTLIEQYGFEKDVDYWEFKSVCPLEEGVPPKLVRLRDRILERSGVRLLEFKKRKEIIARAPEMFQLIDDSFEELYGTVPLTQKQMNYYIDQYFPFVDKDFVKVAVDENDKVVGFMFALPSLSKGFQKANGRLFPLGLFHILRSLKTYDILDFYLAGISKEYQGKGIDLMMVMSIVDSAMEKGVQFSESNPELESNKKIHAQWKYFNPTLHKKRRIYKKEIK